ncbi:MAG: 3-deoxy-manno-octulosonate cytidylyltransferase [Oligoflexia bacterium]|nr:3-deoxy-manno-octulosonate cytidylyltransferase [Oligoflexia bacterium]MBF0364001.1 3-deoxy-manno-octulosonate cytidylyltransferase [Oligoflexia bacterium]
MAMDVLILIPARFSSSRFPGKPLATIAGKSMIERVYSNASSAFETAVVTDHDEIAKHVLAFGGKVVRIDDEVESGSDRIYLAYKRFYSKSKQKVSLIINVQGDEPLLTGSELKRLAEFHLSSSSVSFDITTIVKARSGHDSYEDFQNPNIVKAVLSPESSRCHYFSRSPLPYQAQAENEEFSWYQHIGVYSYRPQALQQFLQAKPSRNQQKEKLEQLKALDIGLTFGAITTTLDLQSVDRPSDIAKVEAILACKSKEQERL